jgi:lauroyl/myristoyl acyltransferase
VINPDDSGRKYLKVLQSNGILVLLVDGNVYTGGVDWPLFGRMTRVPDGPVRLAKAAGAPLVGGYCRRIGDRSFRIRLECILDSGELEARSEHEALARTYGALERFIGENADQWCLFRRMWGD